MGPKFGLTVIFGHALGYSPGGGALRWAPEWFKYLIVEIWNPIACWWWGHVGVRVVEGTWKKEGLVKENICVCVNCSKKLDPE